MSYIEPFSSICCLLLDHRPSTINHNWWNCFQTYIVLKLEELSFQSNKCIINPHRSFMISLFIFLFNLGNSLTQIYIESIIFFIPHIWKSWLLDMWKEFHSLSNLCKRNVKNISYRATSPFSMVNVPINYDSIFLVLKRNSLLQ